jgi:hypothetical protein
VRYNAKTETGETYHRHDSELIDVIVTMDTVDRPGDGALVARARQYLQAVDLMQPLPH